MNLQVSDFFFRGSPFWPDVDLRVVDRIKQDLREDPTYYPGEAIAKHLVLVGGVMSMELVGEKVKINRSKMTIMPDEAVAYSKGFVAAVSLLQFSYVSVAHGLSAARQMLQQPELESRRQFLNAHLEYGARLLSEDISGKRLIEDFVRKESRQSTNLYYKVGLEAARRTFLAYCEQLGVR